MCRNHTRCALLNAGIPLVPSQFTKVKDTVSTRTAGLCNDGSAYSSWLTNLPSPPRHVARPIHKRAPLACTPHGPKAPSRCRPHLTNFSQDLFCRHVLPAAGATGPAPCALAPALGVLPCSLRRFPSAAVTALPVAAHHLTCIIVPVPASVPHGLHGWHSVLSICLHPSPRPPRPHTLPLPLPLTSLPSTHPPSPQNPRTFRRPPTSRN